MEIAITSKLPMNTITQLVEEHEKESQKRFQRKCQKKIDKFERKYQRKKCKIECPYCKEISKHICKGKRQRKLLTSQGKIDFLIQQMKCKKCKKIHRPTLKELGIKRRERISEEFLNKAIQTVIHTSYETASNIVQVYTNQKISGRSIQRVILKKSEEIEQQKEEAPPEEFQAICEDSTKIKTGITKRGSDIKIKMAILGRDIRVNPETGEVKRRRLISRILSVEVGKEEIYFQHTAKNVMSDGGERVKKKKQYQGNDTIFHRCQWHLSRMLGFALYNDGLKTKKERREYVSKLANIIKYSFNNYKKYYEDLMLELKKHELYKAVKYLKNAKEEFYNTKKNPIMIDGIPLLANSPVERVMREIERRLDIGVRWSEQGAKAMTNVRLSYLYI